MTDRKLVKDKFDCLNWSIEDKTVDKVIEHLKKERDRVLSDPKYKSAEIAFYPSDSYDPYGPRSDKEYIYVVGVREENDEEYTKRMKLEQEQQAYREDYEKKQLAILLAKYALKDATDKK